MQRLRKLPPLHVRTRDGNSPSVVAVGLRLDLVDYLQEIESGKILKGYEKAKPFHGAVWIMVYEHDNWFLHSIEPGIDIGDYTSKPNQTSPLFLEPGPAATVAP